MISLRALATISLAIEDGLFFKSLVSRQLKKAETILVEIFSPRGSVIN